MKSGVGRACACHPSAVSLVNTTDVNRVPVLDQMLPVCVPVSPGAFQKRMPVIYRRRRW